MTCKIDEIEIHYEGKTGGHRCSRLSSFGYPDDMSRSLDIAIGKGFQCYLREKKSDVHHHYGIYDCERITRGGQIRKIEIVDKPEISVR